MTDDVAVVVCCPLCPLSAFVPSTVVDATDRPKSRRRQRKKLVHNARRYRLGFVASPSLIVGAYSPQGNGIDARKQLQTTLWYSACLCTGLSCIGCFELELLYLRNRNIPPALFGRGLGVCLAGAGELDT